MLAPMARVPKPLKPLDHAVAQILAAAVGSKDISRRALADLTGMSINRLGIILREEEPPATLGEVATIAYALGMSAGAVVRRAEATIPDHPPVEYVSHHEAEPAPTQDVGIDSTEGPKIVTPKLRERRPRRTGTPSHGHNA
jgi:transcriptional regulator with XRE-family HTH domain